MARRSPALFGLLVLSAIGCTGPPAEVVIETRVGEVQARSELEAARETIAALAEVGDQWWTQRDQRRATPQVSDAVAGSEGTPSAPDPIAYKPVPPQESSSFAAQLHALREGPIDEAAMLTRNLAEAGPQLWPEIAALLLAERERPQREYKQVLALIGGDVPNRYGHFALHWKKAHGYDVRVSEDWFEDLLGVASVRVSKPLHPVLRDTLLTVALLRAASRAAREDPKLVADVVSTLLDAGYVLDGTFRDEVGRSIDLIGDPAISHLLRESVAPEGADEASTAARRAAYATYCLDRMDRLHPSRAIEAASHERLLLADVLEAYALVRDGEAAPLLLDHVDADAPGVRRSARIAFESYVTGPLPTVRRKSIRLLGGRTSTQRAELSYREHARLAIRQRLTLTAPDLLEPECELWRSGGLVDASCEGQPERLFRAYVELLDQRRMSRRDATVARALSSDDRIVGAAMLDTLLSDGSEPVDPDLIAPFYSEVAAEIEASGDPARAAQLLRKSAMLLADADAERARALSVDALVLEAQVEGVDERGRKMLLGTARDLAPDEPTVTAALGQLEAQIDNSSAGLRDRLRVYVLTLLACLGLLAWFGAFIHRPREATPHT